MRGLIVSLVFWLSFAAASMAQDGYRWAVQPTFDDAGSSHDGVVPVKAGGLWGLISGAGTWVAEPQFEEIGASAFGRFAVKRNGKWGLVGTDGQELVPLVYDAIGTPDALTPVKAGAEWRLIDAAGNPVGGPLPIDDLMGNDGECVLGSQSGTPVVFWAGDDPGATSLNGMAKVYPPADGRILVDLGGQFVQLYCDSLNLSDSTPRFEDARRASGGFFAFKQGGLWGFEPVDFGLEPIAPTYTAVRDFSEGLAPVQTDTGKWGYIDRRGTMVIAPQFDIAYGHSDGLAGVRIGDLRGFIDRSGAVVIAPQFENYWRHSAGVVPVKSGGLWGVIIPAVTDRETALDLPLLALSKTLAGQPRPMSVVPSTPHFYFGQDIQSRHDIVISPDGSVMLTILTDEGLGGSGEIALWDRSSHRLIRKISLAGLLQAVLLLETSIIAAGTDQGDIVLLDAVTGAELYRQRMTDGPIGALALSPDGKMLASLGGGFVHLWSLQDGDHRAAFRASEKKLTIATDGKSLWLGAADGGVRQIGLEGAVITRSPAANSGGSVFSFSGPMQNLRPDMALSPQGTLVRSLSEIEQQPDQSFAARFWLDLSGPDGSRVIELPKGTQDILTVAISDDGSQIAYAASVHEDYSAFWALVDAKTGKELQRESFSQGFGWVDRLRILSDGKVVLIGGEGGDIREVTPLQADVPVVTYGAPLLLTAGAVALPSETDVFTLSASGKILHWDMAVGALNRVLETNVESGLESFMVTDGTSLAVLDGFDESLFAVYDLETLELTDAVLPGAVQENALVDGAGRRAPTDAVIEARLEALPRQGEFGPFALPLAGGRFGLIADTVGENRLYDLASGELAVTFLAAPDGEWLVLTAEGFFAASPNGGRLISISNGLRSFSADQVFQALYRPDLVAAKLAGDPEGLVADAAARLDLGAVLGSGPAPRTRLAFPAFGTKATGELIEVGVDLVDDGGGVGRVEWRVNGLTAHVETRAAEALEATEEATTRATLALEPGRNVIEVVAYNSAGLIASTPVSTVVTWDGGGALSVPALYVLAVGVNDYADGRLRLTYAANDAKAFSEAVAKAGQGLFAKTETTLLLDENVTREGLEAAFDDLAAKVRPNDVFLFFLAGHGKTVDGTYHFIPADFTFSGDDPVRQNAIPQNLWQDWMARVTARKSVMIYDTCESGSLTNSRGLDAALAQSAAIDRLTRAMGRTILSASTDDAPALEGYQGHGVLTFALLQAIEAGDANGNGMLEVTELAAFIDEKVPQYSAEAFGYRQVPQMSIRGSDFALGAQVAVLDVTEERFPNTMSHVVAGGTEILDRPGGNTVQVIEPGVFFGVFVIEENEGYARIAKDGTALGWVPVASLGKLQ